MILISSLYERMIITKKSIDSNSFRLALSLAMEMQSPGAAKKQDEPNNKTNISSFYHKL